MRIWFWEKSLGMLVMALCLGLVIAAGQQKQQIMEIPRPTRMDLDTPDARRVLEAQRYHESRKAIYQQRRAEMLEAEKELTKAGEQVDALLGEIRAKYKCFLCDLTWEMTWIARAGSQFATIKKEKESER